MDDTPLDLVTVAVADTAAQAELLKNELAAAGIAAALSGEETVAMLWTLGNAVGGIQVQVAAADAQDARAVLERRGAEPDDGAVATTATIKHFQEDEEPSLTEREQRAQRAFRAAVFGLLFIPLEIYAFVLVMRVLFSRQRLEGRPRSHAKYAAVIVGAVPALIIISAIVLLLGPTGVEAEVLALPRPTILVGTWEGKYQTEQGEVVRKIVLKSGGKLVLSESGAQTTECQGSWGFDHHRLHVYFRRCNPELKHLEAQAFGYGIEDCTATDMILVGPERVRMVRIK